jgi:hypothetical protein
VRLAADKKTLTWMKKRPPHTLTYTVTGTANVRTSPTTERSAVVGKLSFGDSVRAEPTGDERDGWAKIAEGPFVGKFVWRGNLREPADIETQAPTVGSRETEEPTAPDSARRTVNTPNEYLQRTYLNGNSSCITLDVVPYFEKECREGDDGACAALRCGSEANAALNPRNGTP